jgi:hypothetical protein
LERVLETLEQIKRTIPTNSGSPPAEVFGIIRQALLVHLLGQPCENATADIGHIPAFGQDHSPAVARTVCAVVGRTLSETTSRAASESVAMQLCDFGIYRGQRDE